MGLEKYEAFVRRARNTLTYDPGWSRDNATGGWRTLRPELDEERCNQCDLCWLYCPDSVVSKTLKPEIDLEYCKGCGICAEECPTKAIDMVPESSFADGDEG